MNKSLPYSGLSFPLTFRAWPFNGYLTDEGPGPKGLEKNSSQNTALVHYLFFVNLPLVSTFLVPRSLSEIFFRYLFDHPKWLAPI